MIVDTSAIVAVLRNEPEASRFESILEKAQGCRISAANYLEAPCVVDSVRDPLVSARLDDFPREATCEIEPVTVNQARLAYRDYGKGSGHVAQLNFGDCFAYALAKEKHQPLLFKGQDFGHTDVAQIKF